MMAKYANFGGAGMAPLVYTKCHKCRTGCRLLKKVLDKISRWTDSMAKDNHKEIG